MSVPAPVSWLVSFVLGSLSPVAWPVFSHPAVPCGSPPVVAFQWFSVARFSSALFVLGVARRAGLVAVVLSGGRRSSCLSVWVSPSSAALLACPAFRSACAVSRRPPAFRPF